MARVMSVEQACRYIREHRLLLHYDDRLLVDLHTMGKKVPISLRRSVYKNRDVLHKLMAEGSAKLCPAPRLHRRSWQYVSPGYTRCNLCVCLDKSMSDRQSDAIAS